MGKSVPDTGGLRADETKIRTGGELFCQVPVGRDA